MDAIDARFAGRCMGLLLLAVLLVAAPIARGQEATARKDRSAGYWIYSCALGPSLPTGDTSSTTNTGLVFNNEFGWHGSGRWVYPLNILLSFSYLPDAVVRTTSAPKGQTTLAAFTFDPAFDLVRGHSWGMYVTGGGGFSYKEASLLQYDPSCDSGGPDPCYSVASSASSNQPVLDGGLGFTYRVGRNSILQLFQESKFVDMFTPAGSFPGFETAGERMVVLTFGARVNFAHGPNPATTPY